jgi:hypothetical protein
MNRNLLLRSALLAGVLGATLLAPLAAIAAPPIIAEDPGRPSALTITGGSTYVLSGQGAPYRVACVVFVNHGPRVATKVGLNLAVVDASGTVLGVDVIYPRGKFFVDKRSAFSGGGSAIEAPNGNCHPFNATRDERGSTFRYKMGRDAPPTDVAAILVSAREIVYDDGTAWRTDQVPKTGDHVALPVAPPFAAAVPDGPPVVTPAVVAGAPIAVTDAFDFESASQEYAGRIPYISRGRSTCMFFTNNDTRVAKHVRVDLALVDRKGEIVGVEEMHPRGTFSPGVDKPPGDCISVRGKWDADSFVYGDPATPIGRILAVPVLVEFADGTSWQNPNPPKIGDAIRP